MEPDATANQTAILPLTIMTAADVARLGRELDEIEEFNLQSSVRDAGKQPQLPRISRGLETLAAQKQLKLLVEADRQQLAEYLNALKLRAPVMHISFASDPKPAFLAKLVTWLRNEIHPLLLVNVGLQPGIAAGCIVRTANKYFDFSLRKHLADNNKLLVQALMEQPANE